MIQIFNFLINYKHLEKLILRKTTATEKEITFLLQKINLNLFPKLNYLDISSANISQNSLKLIQTLIISRNMTLIIPIIYQFRQTIDQFNYFFVERKKFHFEIIKYFNKVNAHLTLNKRYKNQFVHFILSFGKF